MMPTVDGLLTAPNLQGRRRALLFIGSGAGFEEVPVQPAWLEAPGCLDPVWMYVYIRIQHVMYIFNTRHTFLIHTYIYIHTYTHIIRRISYKQCMCKISSFSWA